MTKPTDPKAQGTLGVQISELVPWVREHPVRGGITILLLLGAIATILNPPVAADPMRINVGDCLYIRTAAAGDTSPTARPAGEPVAVEAVLMSGSADRGACGVTHSHEVSLLVDIPFAAPPSGVNPVPAPPTRAELRAGVEADCDTAFPGFVGHPLVGSSYVTFAAVPPPEAWLEPSIRAVCLIARADGQWMTDRARDSRQ